MIVQRLSLTRCQNLFRPYEPSAPAQSSSTNVARFRVFPATTVLRLDGGVSIDETLLEIDEALQRLARHSLRLARVVECRFFAGLGERETARALDLSERTVRRDWTLARAWLYRELGGSP
jgi:DNA-directed RNA polymerase specialized sigma24 family protein